MNKVTSADSFLRDSEPDAQGRQRPVPVEGSEFIATSRCGDYGVWLQSLQDAVAGVAQCNSRQMGPHHRGCGKPVRADHESKSSPVVTPVRKAQIW